MDKAEIGRVMELAASIFAEHGFSGVGMRELCSRCGVAAPTIYHYFGSKEKLFDAVCADKYAEAMTQACDIVNPALPLDRQLDLSYEVTAHAVPSASHANNGSGRTPTRVHAHPCGNGLRSSRTLSLIPRPPVCSAKTARYRADGSYGNRGL